MQNPSDSGLFHIGYWGISPGSEDWESLRPHQGYDTPILAFHLDEQHGIAHSLHKTADPDRLYLMQWHLLTGRVDMLMTDLPSTISAAYALVYSPDLDCYVVGTPDNTTYLIDPRTGKVLNSTTNLPLGGCKGMFVSGQRVGRVSNTGVRLWDTFDGSISGTYGNNLSDLDPGHFGGIWSAVQNTRTSHVTLSKPFAGDVAAINFLASTREIPDDISACGTPDGIEFQDFTQQDIDSWIRDWSWKTYAGYDLRRLQGNSSLAGAAWAMLTDVNGSARWGAGLPADLFDISSFEALHAQCVQAWPYRNRIARENLTPGYYQGVPYQLDYLLDTRTSASALLSQEFLGAANGYRHMQSGKLAVGIDRPGLFSGSHFTERDTGADSVSVTYRNQSGVLNRVKVQYTEVRREYRSDFAVASDEWYIAKTGRVADKTLTLSGIARPGQAELVARTVLDQAIGSRREVEWKTHYLGYLLTAADVVEMTNSATGLARVPLRLTLLEEDADGGIKLTGSEQLQQLATPRESGPVQTPFPINTDPPEDPTPIPVGCDQIVAVADVGAIAWFNGGATYSAGSYTLTGIGGAALSGFEVVTRDSTGAVVLIGDASGAFSLTDAGPIGLRATDGAAEGTFQLCLPPVTTDACGHYMPYASTITLTTTYTDISGTTSTIPVTMSLFVLPGGDPEWRGTLPGPIGIVLGIANAGGRTCEFSLNYGTGAVGADGFKIERTKENAVGTYPDLDFGSGVQLVGNHVTL